MDGEEEMKKGGAGGDEVPDPLCQMDDIIQSL